MNKDLMELPREVTQWTRLSLKQIVTGDQTEQCQLSQPIKFHIYQWTVQKARRWPLEQLIRHQHPPSQHWPLNKISFEGILPNATFWGLKCGLICAQLQTSTKMLSFNISNICLNPTTSNNFTMSNFFRLPPPVLMTRQKAWYLS